MTYENLLIEATDEMVEVCETMFYGCASGYQIDDTIFINENLSFKEKRCTLAEELGHYYKTYGNILDKKDIKSIKQEIIARRWSYEKLITIIDLIRAYESGVKNKYELAEFLDVTENFLEEALNYYSCKYGLFYEKENYIIYFDPLGIAKKFTRI